MKEEELLEAILKTSFTKPDVHRRVRILREYLEHRFFSGTKKPTLADYLKEKNVSAEDSDMLSSWGEEFYKTFTKDNAYDLVNGLSAKIKDLPLANLYLPFEPDAKEMQKLGTWFRDNVDKTVLLEPHTEIGTFGGCSFAWDGVYHDYSLRYYLDKHRQEIWKVIDGFVSK